MRSILIAAAALSLAFGSTAFAADKCRDAKGKFIKCPPPATSSMAGMKMPVCRVGKPCGKTCIAKDKVCHK